MCLYSPRLWALLQEQWISHFRNLDQTNTRSIQARKLQHSPYGRNFVVYGLIASQV